MAPEELKKEDEVVPPEMPESEPVKISQTPKALNEKEFAESIMNNLRKLLEEQ